MPTVESGPVAILALKQSRDQGPARDGVWLCSGSEFRWADFGIFQRGLMSVSGLRPPEAEAKC